MMNNHTGLTRRIRELLERSPKPLTQKEIAVELNSEPKRVTASLCAMISRIGGACHAGKQGAFNLYGMPGRDEVKPKRRPANVAGGRYDPPPSELRRDPFEHRRLALDGPR